MAAIRVLQALRESGATATREQQAALVRYVGWGGLPQAFDAENSAWQSEFHELGRLLSNEEYDCARRSTQDAHYTAEPVVRAIYDGLQRLGFEGGRIWDPAAGTGHFIGMMPPAMREKSEITAIELDPLTAEIGAHLYPSTTYINRGLQDVVVPQGHFDAVVGNPPFGSQSVYDPQHRELSGLSIHNYFLAKSLEKIRPGAPMAMVVSRYFLDAQNSVAREYLADRAHFLGAVRLPNTAFRKNALTEVTTDIVFFQKAQAGEETDRSWVGVGEVLDPETGEAITLSDYYVKHPEQMIGHMAITGKMHSGGADLIGPPGHDIAAEIHKRLAVLPAGVYKNSPAPQDALSDPDKPELILPNSLKVGSYFVDEAGRLARRLPDLLDRHDYQLVVPKNERASERIRGMIEIRQALRSLMAAEQQESTSDADLAAPRAALNRAYDQFVKRHGHISSQANRLAMAEDPEYPLLFALEGDYDRGVSADVAKKHGVTPRPPSANKAAIFSKRVMSPRRTITSVATARDALVVSMNEKGRVDMGRMMRLTGRPEASLVAELKGLIYDNPATGAWETADQYLTGNVRTKLVVAEAAAKGDGRYLAHVEALRAVQPAPIDPVDISVQLGSTWVPQQHVDQFVTHLLGNVYRNINYQPSLGMWFSNIARGDRTTNSVTWGTEHCGANEIISAILTNKPVQVRVPDGVDANGKPTSRVDPALTAAAAQKADEIKQAFLDWIWEDKGRREELAALYNNRFNTNVPVRYDGSHLTLPGSSAGITLRPHQKDAIWRGVQEGTALFDHVVGAGKTLVCVGVVMESKRMGLLNKPMVVVPNHLLLQWKDAFYSLYPEANILVASKDDFKKENRERLFGRIATGDWDAVIVGHSSFKKIGMPEEALERVVNEQISDLTGAIVSMRKDGGDRMTIKDMEKVKDRMEARLKRKADTGAKDKAVTFADLGVDGLIVDEAHEFKNLAITTSLSGVAGLGNLAGSEKAFDLFVKCRYLQDKYLGRGVFFATGTPISNTLAELYTMQRYMHYDEMKARGIVHFDAWASTFGQVVTGWELDATGVNYRLNSRFSKFQNVPELATQYRSFADVISKADLERQAQERGTRFPVPRLKGGKPQNVIVERSAQLAQYMGVLEPLRDDAGAMQYRADGTIIKSWTQGSIIHRMENLPKDPSIDNPLKITNDARKAGLDFRLIDPDAPDDAGSKINAAVENIYRIWSEWSDRRGTQLVFCDLSTPKGKSRQVDAPIEGTDDGEKDVTESISMDELLAGAAPFSVYDDVRSKLISLGVPEAEIRFVHDAKTDLQKAKLFDDMNRGTARILLGSTAKMGAGTNVQLRLVAEHHLDAPWRPSDLEQREGRIIRQGNMFYEQDPEGFEVEILRYATKQTYDSRMWQTIEYKAAGIEQFRRGDSLVRVIDDVAGEAANAAEMKAAATGNPLIFQQVKLSAELKKVEAIYSNFRRNVHNLESRIGWLRDADPRAARQLAKWDAEILRRAPGDTFSFTAAGRTFTVKDRDALLEHVMSAMKHAITKGSSATLDTQRDIDVGDYRGFRIQVYCQREEIQFTVIGEDAHEPKNLRYRADEKFNITGLFSRIDNYLANFEANREAVLDVQTNEKRELTKALAEQGRPFPQHAQLEALRADVRDVMTELKLMQADDTYVSTWKPKSASESVDAPGADRRSMRA